MGFDSDINLSFEKCEKVLVVGLELSKTAENQAFDANNSRNIALSESLDELEKLLLTLNVSAQKRVVQKRRKPDPGTLIGKGKAEEIREIVEAECLTAVVFDDNLTPSQTRNLQKIINCKILDRAGVILEIFSNNARTSESKTQIEIAKLKYILPRLSGLWTHLERQRGGGGVGMMGMGEKQIETDRRLIHKRIAHLEKKLIDIRKGRDLRRRKRGNYLKAALVGYTNAGKTSLMNVLTKSKLHAEDKLFATLDASVRTLKPGSQPALMLIDTVGFIRKLPPDLVASFKSTLEEIQEADLVIHVVDVSHPEFEKQIEITNDVLKELNCDKKPSLLVMNKSDLLGKPFIARVFARSYLGRFSNTVITSIKNEISIDRLRNEIIDFFYSHMPVIDLLLPHSEAEITANIHKNCEIIQKRYMEKGVFLRVRTTDALYGEMNLDKFKL